jgi:Zn-dependent metalloprotease
VDDAEDAEVILHEYGHAIHFAQNFVFDSEQAGAISEGFGDYWAVTVADVVSKSLWDIRQALGNVKADTIILQGSFDFPGTTMPDLANRTVAAAQQIYGTAAAKAVTKAFTDRGILPG